MMVSTGVAEMTARTKVAPGSKAAGSKVATVATPAVTRAAVEVATAARAAAAPVARALEMTAEMAGAAEALAKTTRATTMMALAESCVTRGRWMRVGSARAGAMCCGREPHPLSMCNRHAAPLRRTQTPPRRAPIAAHGGPSHDLSARAADSSRRAA